MWLKAFMWSQVLQFSSSSGIDITRYKICSVKKKSVFSLYANNKTNRIFKNKKFNKLSADAPIITYGVSSVKLVGSFLLPGDKDDDDDDDADDKMQSSVLTGGDEGRQESQEQNEVDHGDFEMVVRGISFSGLCPTWLLHCFLLRNMAQKQMLQCLLFYLFSLSPWSWTQQRMSTMEIRLPLRLCWLEPRVSPPCWTSPLMQMMKLW